MKKDWIKKIFNYPELLRMGHGQNENDLNIGLGWLYYAEVRISKPKKIVCIGSWRGFVPIILAQALKDNKNKGKLIFIDPSLADNFWKDKQKTLLWFKKFGISNIEHHLKTTQEYVQTKHYQKLNNIGLVFIDGYHTAKQAEYDFKVFEKKLGLNPTIFFHDSIRPYISGIYGKEKKYEHDVYKFINKLKKIKQYQCLDFYEGSGVTLVKKNFNAHK